ncbi:MAG TPA: hypothetical protein VNB94_02970 [Mycobacteriales bacterium]|nr:hypothetical protein [Mycobacteriales bacterium]
MKDISSASTAREQSAGIDDGTGCAGVGGPEGAGGVGVGVGAAVGSGVGSADVLAGGAAVGVEDGVSVG